jgi:hypothetical protein
MTKKLDDIALVVVRDRRFYRWLLTKGGVAVSSGREATAILANVSAHREKIRIARQAPSLSPSAIGG